MYYIDLHSGKFGNIWRKKSDISSILSCNSFIERGFPEYTQEREREREIIK
jgi:hypothetical protein